MLSQTARNPHSPLCQSDSLAGRILFVSLHTSCALLWLSQSIIGPFGPQVPRCSRMVPASSRWESPGSPLDISPHPNLSNQSLPFFVFFQRMFLL